MRRLSIAVFLVSAAAIGYEILLMRVLSIVQWHHFAWMIISIALLGYGVSGTAIALVRQRLEPHFDAAFASSAMLFSVTMIGCFVAGQRVPFNPLEIIWEARQLLYLGILYAVFFVPFFFAACCIGLALTCRSHRIRRLYFSDLVGAGAGAVMIIALLFVLFPQTALLMLAALPVLAAALAIGPARARAPAVVAACTWLAAVGLLAARGGPELHVSEYKGLSQALEVVDSRVVDEASSPLGLVTVVASPTVPIRHAPGLSFTTRHIPPEQLAVFTDADAMSVINRYDGDPATAAYLADVSAALPYRLLTAPETLVLGAGAGSDVLLALVNGAVRIDAVELDPQVVDLVTRSHADFAGGIYDDPRVSLHIAEARGFVRGSEQRYDLVQIGLLDSFAAAGAGVQALGENYLYTVESIRDYLDRLAAGGLLSITRWIKSPPRDSLKLVATAIEALAQSGVAEPGRQLVVIRSWNTVTLLVRNTPFGSEDIDAVRAFARSRSFDTAWYPGMPESEANRFNRLAEPWLYRGTRALLGDAGDEFMDDYKFYIRPASDDRPYFFHFFKWGSLSEVLALRTAGGAGLIEWGYLVVVATLAQALVAGALLILLPLSLARRSASAGWRSGAYFLLLGLAFLFVEIAFIQKFILFLAHPLYSVAVVLAGFLVFAGAGSALSGTFARHLRARGLRPISAAVAGIAAFGLAYLVLLPHLFSELAGVADGLKILLSIALIAPPAFLMGMPFPLGLERIAQSAPAFVPWAWGINGFASVVSAILATLLAIHFGFSAVVLLALVLYAAAAALAAQM